MKNIFLTGEISIGKSTIIKSVIKDLKQSIGGYFTKRIINGSNRLYFAYDISSKVNIPIKILEVNSSDWSKKYFPDAFNYDLVSIIDYGLANRDILILDELGCNEKDYSQFTSKVFEALDSENIVLGVIRDSNCDFLNKIRSRDDTIILNVNISNRNTLSNEILKILDSFNA